MNRYTVFLLFCFVLSACSTTDQATSQVTKKPKAEATNTPVDSPAFPSSWLGNWEGDLNIYKNNQMVQSIPMELELLEIDSSDNFVWAIIYGEDKVAGRRAYELETMDATKGHYRVDEKNTIKLEAYLFDNKLLSWYEVMGNQMLVTYEKKGTEILFEIVFGSTDPVSVTGNQKVDGEDIPAVRTFPIGGYQRAILKRMK